MVDVVATMRFGRAPTRKNAPVGSLGGVAVNHSAWPQDGSNANSKEGQ